MAQVQILEGINAAPGSTGWKRVATFAVIGVVLVGTVLVVKSAKRSRRSSRLGEIDEMTRPRGGGDPDLSAALAAADQGDCAGVKRALDKASRRSAPGALDFHRRQLLSDCGLRRRARSARR